MLVWVPWTRENNTGEDSCLQLVMQIGYWCHGWGVNGSIYTWSCECEEPSMTISQSPASRTHRLLWRPSKYNLFNRGLTAVSLSTRQVHEGSLRSLLCHSAFPQTTVSGRGKSKNRKIGVAVVFVVEKCTAPSSLLQNQNCCWCHWSSWGYRAQGKGGSLTISWDEDRRCRVFVRH